MPVHGQLHFVAQIALSVVILICSLEVRSPILCPIDRKASKHSSQWHTTLEAWIISPLGPDQWWLEAGVKEALASQLLDL